MAATTPPPDNACSSCGRTISRDKSLCNACAGTATAPPIETAPCTYCGAAVKIGATTCGTCGRPFAQPPNVGSGHARPRRDTLRGNSNPPLAPAIETAPCTYCGAAVKSGATACGTCGWDWSVTQGSDPDGDAKRREWARGAAVRDAAWHQQRVTSPARPRGQVWGLLVVGLTVAIVGIVAFAVLRSSDPPKPTVSPVAVTPPTAPPPPPETPARRVANAKTFAQAIDLARPAFADTTDELGDGAKLLANYAAKKLRWDEVHVPAETTLARVEKDPQLERGKRLCATGEIERIARRDLEDRRVYVGRLRTVENDAVAFVATGTTGDLVKRSTGTLCGVVLGMSGDAVSILGMFDLDENRMPLVEQ